MSSTAAALRIVYLEADPGACELARARLASDGIAAICEQVDTPEAYRAALAPRAPDLILADFNPPGIDGFTALALKRELCPAVPFIFVSGALGEDVAVESLHHGATDFVLKGSLGRLGPAVRRALREHEDHRIRLQAEVQLRLLSEAIEQSPVAVVITDEQNRIVFANRRLCELSGYTRAELFGQNPKMLGVSEQPPGLLAEMWEHLNAGRTWQGEFRNRRKNGEAYTVRATITPVRHENGATVNYLAVQEDVSLWKRDQERRRELEAQLFQAQKMESIGTLAGGIAHDFNNILTGILGFTELASSSLPDHHPVRADLFEVHQAGLRAKDLIAQILTFSRQKDSQQEPLDLAKAVSDALRLVRAGAPATIEFDRRLQSAYVRADPTGIHQIVLNLCTNAVHAMRGTTGRLTVGVQPIEVDETLAHSVPKLMPGSQVCLSVADTGHGMSAATVARLFEPFFTTKEAGEGTGLGLALVRGIVQAHNGAIRVTSAIGAGSCFEIFFPACPEGESPEVRAARVRPGHKECILVVDDEKSVSSFASVRLEQLNYRVEIFNDPRDALAAIRTTPAKYAALVSDRTMPHLTGTDLLRAAREVRPDLPAVLMSGYGGDGTVPAGLSGPARTLTLNKPFNGDDLGRAVAHALHGPE